MYLFDDISRDSMEEIIPCFKPVIREYKKDDVILTYEAKEPSTLVMMMDGEARLDIINEEGEQSMLDTYKKDDVLGDLFSLPLSGFYYTVVAKTDCRVMFLDYMHMTTPCEKLCEHHNVLIRNLLVMTAQKTQELSLRISLFGQKTIRDKLLAYLKNVKTLSGGKQKFRIPLSLSELSEYLCIDRAAMMREIKHMKDDGLINSKSREFELL